MNTSKSAKGRSTAPLILVILLVSSGSTTTIAQETSRTLLVSTIGIDSNSCGSKANPCRTISRAIANASAGDTIFVEPGRYGDLNRDSDLSDPGEEQTPPAQQCAVCIRKRVNVFSTGGAAVTEIVEVSAHVVRILADGVVFGAQNRGFTLTGAGGGSLTVELARNVRVSGNISQEGGVGLFVMAERGPVYITHNIVRNNGFGILVTTSRNGGPGYVIVRHNSSIGNFDLGIEVDGFVPHVVTDNVVTQTAQRGFVVRNNSWISRNVIANNGGGFFVEETGEAIPGSVLGGGVRLYRNVIVNNISAGIEISDTGAAPNHQIHFNVIYGNGKGDVIPHGIFAPPLPLHCGLLNWSGGFVNATDNFWGAPTGPGPDPADKAGPGPCDVSGKTAVLPFAKIRF